MIPHLRALTPAWPISRREARWIAERQARLLLADAGITTPPVPERIVSDLSGVRVYPLTKMPIEGLLSASQPNANGGDILIDATLPMAEQRLTLMHELKHIIDGGHATKLRTRGRRSCGEQLCTEFAFGVLMPASWLRADWNDGKRDPPELAERYQVPVEAVERRLYGLGLVKRRPRQRHQPCASGIPQIKR